MRGADSVAYGFGRRSVLLSVVLAVLLCVLPCQLLPKLQQNALPCLSLLSSVQVSTGGNLLQSKHHPGLGLGVGAEAAIRAAHCQQQAPDNPEHHATTYKPAPAYSYLTGSHNTEASLRTMATSFVPQHLYSHLTDSHNKQPVEISAPV